MKIWARARILTHTRCVQIAWFHYGAVSDAGAFISGGPFLAQLLSTHLHFEYATLRLRTIVSIAVSVHLSPYCALIVVRFLILIYPHHSLLYLTTASTSDPGF
jgi:hypothetical protein